MYKFPLHRALLCACILLFCVGSHAQAAVVLNEAESAWLHAHPHLKLALGTGQTLFSMRDNSTNHTGSVADVSHHTNQALEQERVFDLTDKATNTPKIDYSLLWKIVLASAFIWLLTMLWNRKLHREVRRREKSETRLAEREALLDAMISQSMDAIGLVDNTGQYLMVNPAFTQLTGYSEAEMLQMKVFDLLPPGTNPQIFPVLLKKRQALRKELKLQRKDGSHFFADVSASPIFIGDQEQFLGIIRDTTARRETEDALRDSREKYQRLVDDIGSKLVIYSHNIADDSLLYVSDGVEAVFGLNKTQVIGTPWAHQIQWLPESLQEARTQISKLLKGETNFSQYELSYAHPDGSLRTVQVSEHASYDVDNTPITIDGIAEDITERKQAERRLRESEQKLRGLYELSPLGIALTNMQGQYIEFNQAFIDICGYSPEELKALDYWTLTPLKYQQQEAEQLNTLLTTGRYGPYKKEYRQKNGKLVPLRLNGVLITGSNGESYIWSLVEDITAQQQYEDDLHHAKDAAEAANHAKSAFIANMSHELRTPLNAIMGFAQLLQHVPQLSDTHKQHINGIYRGGQYLLTLVNDILDLATVEAGRVELLPEEVVLASFFRELQDKFRLRAEAKHIQFDYQAATDLPYSVSIDPKRLRQVLSNLLGNAVKFTEQGAVSLHVGYQDSQLHLSIRDSGPGIAADKQAEVFQPFSQTGENRYQTQGTGLGLAITQKILSLMQGEISLKSELGQGSCFELSIPAPVKRQFVSKKLPELSNVRADIVAYRSSRKDRLRILVVDGIEDNRKMLSEFLGLLGFSVCEADSGAACLKIAPTYKPDLVFMDLQMPSIDGLETVRQLHSHQDFATLPVIAVSLGADEEDIALCERAGCVGYLAKPLIQQDLLAILPKHLPLEWVSQAIDTPDAVSNAPLSEAQRQAIFDLAQAGKIKQLVSYLEALNEQAEVSPQVEALLTLAYQFQLSKICKMLA